MHLLERLTRKRRKRVLGIMSGTSADGIGTALVTIHGFGLDTRLVTEALRVFPYSAQVRERLLHLTTKAGSARDVCLMNYVIGELCGNVPAATGAAYPVVPGNIIPGRGDSGARRGRREQALAAMRVGEEKAWARNVQ